MHGHGHLSLVIARTGEMQRVGPEGSGRHLAEGTSEFPTHLCLCQWFLFSSRTLTDTETFIINVRLELYPPSPGFCTNGNFLALFGN